MDGPEPESGSRALSAYHRAHWRITADRARLWASHRFQRDRDGAALWALVAGGDRAEWGLLLSDLDCYAGLWESYLRGRAPMPPPPEVYLRAGREDWGCLEALLQELFGPEEPEECAAAPDLGDHRVPPR